MPSTMVQADRHGPSMTTFSPVWRTAEKRDAYCVIKPPGSSVIRTAACADVAESTARAAAARIAMKCMLTPPEPFPNRFESAPRLSSAGNRQKFFQTRIIGHGYGNPPDPKRRTASPDRNRHAFAGNALVPRTRSSHDFAAGTVANFGFKRGTRIIMLLVSFRFRSSLRGRGECWQTSEWGH